MLRFRNEQLEWDEEDIIQMSKIIGPELAVGRQRKDKTWVRRSPMLPSLIKMAKRRGILLSPRCQRELEKAEALRSKVTTIKERKDAKGDPAFFRQQRVAMKFFIEAAQPAYLNADVPGAGKTAAAIRWANYVQAERILVICPNSAKRQWADAIKRWDTSFLPITIVEGTIAQQVAKLSTPKGWVVTHWEALAHARQGAVRSRWDVVIADEAHRMQNREAVRTKTVFLLRADYRMALTAHPYTNNPGELQPILRFLYPDVYRAYWRFFHMHVRGEPKAFGGMEIIGTKRPKLLQWELAPFTIRRSHKELGWRPLTRVPRYAQLTTGMRREYEKLRKEFFVELKEHETAGKRILAIPSVLARVTRLRQYLIDPDIIGSGSKSVKYPVVNEIIEALDGPPVIFTSFVEAATRLQAYLYKQHRRTAIISGSTGHLIERYKKQFLKGKFDALIVITSKGGESLNLGKYGYILWLDLPWNPRGLEQGEGRVYRPEEHVGTMVSCTSYRVIVENTWEDKRLEVKLEDKHRDFQGTFSPKDLMELFG